MGFDISTAKPLEEKSFDINTAKPMEDNVIPYKSTDWAGAPKRIATGLIQGTGEQIKQIGEIGKDVLLGNTIRDIIGKKQGISTETGMLKPSIPEAVQGIQEQAEAKRQQYTNIPKTYRETPEAIPLDVLTVLGMGKAIKSGGFKPKNIPKPVRTIDTAEVLPTTLEKTNIQNIAKNKYVRDNITNFIGKQSPEIAKEAADLTKQVKPAIRQAQNKFYENLGIKDSDPINTKTAIEKIQEEIINKSPYLDKSAIDKATLIFDDILKNTDKKGNISFGKVKEVSNNVFDLAEDNVNDIGRKTSTGKFFSNIGKFLTEAKRTDERISKAGSQYKDLIDAEKLINKTMRLNREMGEMRLEGKIASSFKDKGQMTFKENLQKLEDILKKYPETKNIVDYGGFTDRIKLAQISNDIATKKATTPQGLKRFGLQAIGNVLKVGNPEVHAQLLARGIEKGIVNPEAVAGMSKNYSGILGGQAKTRIGALKDIFTKKKEGK